MDTPDNKPKQKQIGKTKNDLKRRAKSIVKDILAGVPEVEALKNVGYSSNYAVTGKHQILNNPVIQSEFQRVLARAGVDDEAIAAKIRSLINANKSIVVDKDVVQVPDNSTQLGAVTLAAKLRGHIVERSVGLNINVEADPVDLTRWLNTDKDKIVDV